jgi:hypothetical protein
VLAGEVAFDQVAFEPIPKAQRMFGVFRIESCDLVDSALAITGELSVPFGFARIEGAGDFDRQVRSPSFPSFPSWKRARRGPHAHDEIGS